ncbi:LytTR family DNA-binding domain-containing protein [Muricauda sp. SCSIO 64092]|uniref:LytR/AlgR family response regulator transcription factor n=1 Tax=Allomuricauda sp. SCSIO 64092 TaxID=2908842 RepID=UPI001FF437AE|nr:LytTR family DNA-binding domain-containing protein [Muricauda sp. SCSIO 64092]UOY05275.1 LytTR family DNA-binding domain-containing protein [Muricauda sp. SCSIO 64092]
MNSVIKMGKLLKIVIVEDEPISSAYLKKLINDSGIEHEIVAELDSISDCLIFFSEQPIYDIIFMDIHLGDGTCFELLNSLTIEKPIIFLTTFDSYAIEAFRYNSIDYILKPAKLQDINDALNKYWSFKKVDEDEYLARMDQMVSSISTPKYKKRFLVRVRNKLRLVTLNQITCFYSDEGQTHLVDKSGNNHIIDYTLERLEELLDPEQFFRINRKITVSIDEIHSVEDYFNNRLKIRLNSRFKMDMVVSRNRVRNFKSWLKGVS